MNPRLLPLLLALAAFLPATASNAAPRFNGTVHYEFANQQTEVVLSADLIDDSSKENATGTLQVELWATSAPYESGQIHGYMLGSAKLEGLAAGQFYKNLRRTVHYTPPSVRGAYFVTMLLLEYREGRYVIVEHRNFNNATVNLGPLPLFAMQGPWSYQVSNEGGTVEISVAKISHRRTGNTGALKLALWVTGEPYHGGPLHGYEIGSVPKGPLKAGFVYDNVKNVAKYQRPPPGDYYASLVLYEWNGTNFELVAYLDSTSTAHFAAP